MPVAALMALTACSTESADSTVDVTGTDDACIIAQDVVAAGKVGFEFLNESSDVNELYVLKANGDTLGEVENVTTGTSRTLTVDLVAGDYLVRCKPGQTGDGFESPFTVTGEGGTAQAEPDREVAFDAIDFEYEDLDLSSIADGDTIRFVMKNAGEQPHEFEVLDPEGEPIGEVAATNPGESGGATMTFTAPGVYTYQCILVDPETSRPHTELGMTGTFDVAEG
jgi:plastocyanin